MNVLGLALAAFLVAAIDAAAPVRRLDKRMIMENAVRVNSKYERHLNQNFELSAAYSIQFNQCVALKTEPYNDEIMFADSLVEYTAKGQIVSERSYVLFNVCETDYCDYYADDDNLFMVDIDTYMAALSVFYGGMQENYCAACQDSYNYCQYAAYSNGNGYVQQEEAAQDNNAYEAANEEEAEYEAANEEEAANEYEAANEEEQYAEANEDQNDGGRKLMQYQAVKCETCEAFKCFEGMDANEERHLEEQYQYDVDLESIAQWVDTVAACQDTGALLNEKWPLYSGFMCNEDGSGVEIGLFLDGDCSIYTSRESFMNVASEYDQAYMYEAHEAITYPFLNAVSCNEQYISRQEYNEMQQNYDGNAGGDEDYGDASEFCTTLFEGNGDGYYALPLEDCDQDGQEDNAQASEYYSYDYYWYTFVLTYQDSMNPYATCSVLQKMEGEYDPVYNWKRSGQLFDYGTTSSRWDTGAVRDFFADYSKNGMDGWLIAAIVISVAFALLSLCCVMYSCCCKSSAPNKYSRKVAKHRKPELIDDRTGALLM